MKSFPKSKEKQILIQVWLDESLAKRVKDTCKAKKITVKSAVEFGLDHFLNEAKK